MNKSSNLKSISTKWKLCIQEIEISQTLRHRLVSQKACTKGSLNPLMRCNYSTVCVEHRAQLVPSLRQFYWTHIRCEATLVLRATVQIQFFTPSSLCSPRVITSSFSHPGASRVGYTISVSAFTNQRLANVLFSTWTQILKKHAPRRWKNEFPKWIGNLLLLWTSLRQKFKRC